MSPASSKSQQRLFGAAYGGASFPEAKALRKSMSMGQLRDFAATPTKKLPTRVKPPTKRQEKQLTKSSY